jgi:ATPase family associated with various cellular activities (AAA)
MTEAKILTRSAVVQADVIALLRARSPLLWIVTREEARVEGYLIAAARAARYVPLTWDIAAGVRDIDGVPAGVGGMDPGETLTAIAEMVVADEPRRCVWIMRDLPVWLSGPPGAVPLRQLKNEVRRLPGVPLERGQAIIVLSPSRDVPPELANSATVIEWPLPDREEIGTLLDDALAPYTDEQIKKPANGQREQAVQAAIGLSGEEAQACYAKSLVQHRAVEPLTITREKKRVIAREKVLEWVDPLPGGLDAVGGLENLKQWLLGRAAAFSPKARAYGLRAPRGAFLVGVPGCGKTYTAKAFPTAWGVPLLRLDLGALKSKFVGESEGNLRRALQVIETLNQCVVWIDEIEKGLAGATDGSADGGVSSDALGAILSWMQERQGDAFVIATANNIDALPPELLRKGRFDDVWFVDLPTTVEREAILRTALKTAGREKLADSGAVDVTAVAEAARDFTGSEVAELVASAMYAAFPQDREIITTDLLAAVASTVPLIKTSPEKVEKIRAWAKNRARPATAAVREVVNLKTARAVDL